MTMSNPTYEDMVSAVNRKIERERKELREVMGDSSLRDFTPAEIGTLFVIRDSLERAYEMCKAGK